MYNQVLQIHHLLKQNNNKTRRQQIFIMARSKKESIKTLLTIKTLQMSNEICLKKIILILLKKHEHFDQKNTAAHIKKPYV